MTLNPSQIRAVECRDPYIITTACPGAGKTRVLCHRLARLANEVDPRTIVTITFTTAGAREIVDRMGERVGFIGTIHAYMLEQLQRFGKAIGYQPGTIGIIEPEDFEEMIAMAAKTLDLKKSVNWIKKNWHTPEAQLVLNSAKWDLKRRNLVTYDGILEAGLKIIQTQEFRQSVHVTHLLVDEVQDCSTIDWEIIEKLPAENRFLIGDPWQSIFGFRGANPNKMLNEMEEGTATVLELTENYRSDHAICETACRLSGQSMTPRAGADEGIVKECVFQTEVDEASGSQWFIEWSQGRGTPLNEIAVLCRTNRHCSILAAELAKLGLPVAAVPPPPAGGDELLALLAVIHDPQNEPAARRYCKMRQMPQGEVDAMIRCNKAAMGTSLSIQRAITASEALITAQSSDPCLPVQWAFEQLNAMVSPETATVADLMTELKRDPGTINGDGVRVLTYHRAKGREWDCVILTGLEEGNFPGRDTEDESRRLLYVGITRARHSLFLTHCQTRTGFKGITKQEPSRFLKEIIV